MSTQSINVQSEALDPSFGDQGVLTLPIPGLQGTRPILVQALPEGKSLLVFGGAETAPIYIARLHESGALDQSFGQQGVVELSLGTTDYFFPSAIHLLDSKGWLLTGRHRDKDFFVPESLAVVRQNEDGSFDTAFGDGGKVIIRIADLVEDSEGKKAHLVRDNDQDEPDKHLPGQLSLNVFSAVQPQAGRQEKTLISATIKFDFDDLKGIVLRLDDQGNIDKTFNRNGFLLVDIPDVTQRFNYGRGVGVQPDNKVVVCGYFMSADQDHEQAYVIRYQENGTVDTRFGSRGNGVVTLGDSSGSFVLTRLSLKADGTILAVGARGGELTNRSEGLMINLNANGSYNLIFNDGKPLVVDMSPFQLEFGRCTFQADGKLVAVGTSGSGMIDETNRQWIGRYLANGKLDNSFGAGKGWTEFQSPGGINRLTSATYLSDNRIITSNLLISQAPPFDIGGFLVRFVG